MVNGNYMPLKEGGRNEFVKRSLTPGSPGERSDGINQTARH